MGYIYSLVDDEETRPPPVAAAAAADCDGLSFKFNCCSTAAVSISTLAPLFINMVVVVVVGSA